MNIFAWIAFGAVAGLVAHYTDSLQAKGGLPAAILLGIVGSLSGGFLANLIFGKILLPFDLSSFILAIGGALTLLFLHRTLFLNKSED